MRPDQLPEPEELLEGEAMPEIDDQGRELTMTGAFGTELQQRLQENLRQRLNIERRWVSDMRRYQGQVTDAELKEALFEFKHTKFYVGSY